MPAAFAETSGRPDVGQERVDFRAQHVGLAAQCAGRGQHLAGGCSGFGRGGADADDIAGNLRGAAGSVLNVAGDLARRRALLFDCGGDCGGDLVDLADGTLFAKARVAFGAKTKKAGVNAGLFRRFVQTRINTGREPSCPS